MGEINMLISRKLVEQISLSLFMNGRRAFNTHFDGIFDLVWRTTMVEKNVLHSIFIEISPTIFVFIFEIKAEEKKL